MIMLAALIGLVAPADIPQVVHAIEQAENSPWDSPGGALQFTAAAWREDSRLPYAEARNPAVARVVAARRLDRLARAFSARGIRPTVRLLGSAWNRGFNGALQLHRAGQCCDYGRRVENLFNSRTP